MNKKLLLFIMCSLLVYGCSSGSPRGPSVPYSGPVIANFTPNVISVAVNHTESVAITFMPLNNVAATGLSITSGLQFLSDTNPGWSGPSLFGCEVVIESSCVLDLTFSPVENSESASTVILGFSYLTSDGVPHGGTVLLPYNVIGESQ